MVNWADGNLHAIDLIYERFNGHPIFFFDLIGSSSGSGIYKFCCPPALSPDTFIVWDEDGKGVEHCLIAHPH